jgi:hypothetical protein
MRLVICLDCQHAIVANEQEEIEKCKCAKTRLVYENKKYFYSGENTLAIGLDEETLIKAIRMSEKDDKNYNFSGFVCRENDPNFYKSTKI